VPSKNLGHPNIGCQRQTGEQHGIVPSLQQRKVTRNENDAMCRGRRIGGATGGYSHGQHIFVGSLDPTCTVGRARRPGRHAGSDGHDITHDGYLALSSGMNRGVCTALRGGEHSQINNTVYGYMFRVSCATGGFHR
jgi:hypothetical protein